jgi:hypothetical protein
MYALIANSDLSRVHFSVPLFNFKKAMPRFFVWDLEKLRGQGALLPPFEQRADFMLLNQFAVM